MKVYVCIPIRNLSSISGEGVLDFKNVLFDFLKKYYKTPDIEISKTQDSIAAVYVMGEPVYSGHENEITNTVISIVKKHFNVLDVNTRLNYAQFNPSFQPNVSNATTAKTESADRSRINKASETSNNPELNSKINEFDYEKLSQNYQAEEPRFSFDQVILSTETCKCIEEAIGIIEVEGKVFDEWGLRSIIPIASSALSFYGPPGTGKTMAAEAVAHKIGRKILIATYADIESKFHGEGPKMVKAIFKAAERDNAVLFLDESDSLLSKRLTNVTDGSSQAINSMRSQLLISLEQFKGIVIFATNLVINYDRAFLSRLINIEFTLPGKAEREKIWWKHLKSDKIRIPLSDDVDISAISMEYEFCGREIKNSVKNACISVALDNRNEVMQRDLIFACERTKSESEKAIFATDHTKTTVQKLDSEQNTALKEAIQAKLNTNNSANPLVWEEN